MKKPILSEFEDSQDYHIAVEEYCECLEIEILRLNRAVEELKIKLLECEDLLYH